MFLLRPLRLLSLCLLALSVRPPRVLLLWLWAVVLVTVCGSSTVAQQNPQSDLELREQVKRAIRNGSEYLRRNQNANGSWAIVGDRWYAHAVGLTSMAIIAQINADVPVSSPGIQNGLRYLRTAGMKDLKHGVYEGSLMLMALCAAEEYQRDMDQIRYLADLLVRTQSTQGPTSGLWGYELAGFGGTPGGNREDHSNGQFAILALRDAAYAGFEVDRSVWRRAHEHWLRTQNSDGGWGYGANQGDKSKGSMTAAGLSTLAITTRMLQDDSDVDANGRPDCCTQPIPENAFERGKQWMAQHFVEYSNPGDSNWYFYYMYGVERASRLSNVRFYGEHDWYRRGARHLVKAQLPDGQWSAPSGLEKDRILATSFSLIFLSKGLSRVVVNKLDYTSRGNTLDVSGEWNRHPLDVVNLIDLIDGLKGWPPRLTSQVVSLGRLREETAVLDLNQAPVLYLSGKDAPSLTDQHVQWLRDYVDEGGFIYAVANCDGGTFDQGFRQLVDRMFPEGDASLQRLSPEHPVFRSEYLFNSDSVELYGVDFGCRTAIIYSPEDHACLWQKWMRHAPPDRSANLTQRILRSAKIGVNVIAYATGREPPEKLNSSIAAKDRAAERVRRGLTEIAQLRYNGDWDTAPRALRNLLEGLNDTVGLSVSPERRVIPITLEELRRFPIAYMHGRYGFILQPQEQTALRDYLSRGAVLIADSCCGSQRFDRSFRDLMQQMYPDNPLKQIPLDHEMFSTRIGHDLKTVSRRRLVPGAANASIQKRVEKGPPVLEGIEIDGRYAVIYSRYDISCALENQASLACDGYVEEDAMKLAMNLVLYAMLQEIR